MLWLKSCCSFSQVTVWTYTHTQKHKTLGLLNEKWNPLFWSYCEWIFDEFVFHACPATLNKMLFNADLKRSSQDLYTSTLGQKSRETQNKLMTLYPYCRKYRKLLETWGYLCVLHHLRMFFCAAFCLIPLTFHIRTL